jgi:hypothetical protein
MANDEEPGMSDYEGHSHSGSPHTPAGARAEWPRCGARTRSTGEPCRARGDGRGGLCALHSGMTLGTGWRAPLPTWTVIVGPSGLWIDPSRRCAGRWPAERARLAAKWPLRVSWIAAVRLVSSGQVNCGLLYRREGQRFLEELEARGVVVSGDGSESPIARSVRFDSSHAVPERVYRRRRHPRPNADSERAGGPAEAQAATAAPEDATARADAPERQP